MHPKYLATALLALCVLRLSTVAQCQNDVQCKGDRICVNGECVSPEQPQSEAERTDANSPSAVGDEPPKAPELGPWTFWVNPLGFLQFGPTLGVERRVAGNLYLGAHYRYAAMGALYTIAEADNYSSDEIWVASAAVGIAAKYYTRLGDSPHLFYYGLFSEYAWGGHDGNIYPDGYYYPPADTSAIAYTDRSTSIVLGGTLGWRWRLGANRKVLLTLGLLSGVAREVTESREYSAPLSAGYTDYDYRDSQRRNTRFFGMLELGLGYGM